MNRRSFFQAIGLAVAATLLPPEKKEPYNGRFKVYRQTPEEGVQLAGYTGKVWWDAGYVYAPYVPLQLVDFNSLPLTGFKTRFGYGGTRLQH